MTLFDFEFEKYSLTGEELKGLIYDEIQLYHSEEKRKEYERLKKEFPNGILASKAIGKLKKVRVECDVRLRLPRRKRALQKCSPRMSKSCLAIQTNA